MSFEITFPRGRTSDQAISIFESDGQTPIVLTSTDVVRFKLYRRDQAAPLLEIDSAAATAEGSVVTIEQLEPARVVLRVAQGDTANLAPGAYDAEVDVIDDSDAAPDNAVKLAERGVAHIAATGGGEIGID
jgi:hypothetical protein